MYLKNCCKCNWLYPRIGFYKYKHAKSGLYPSCRLCHVKSKYGNTKQLETNFRPKIPKYPKNSSNFRKNSRLIHVYGIDLTTFNKMSRAQKHCCYVCGISKNKLTNKTLQVDHNHSTGKVRKLLCIHCNLALGSLDENIEILEKLINYIKEHE